MKHLYNVSTNDPQIDIEDIENRHRRYWKDIIITSDEKDFDYKTDWLIQLNSTQLNSLYT